MSIVEDNLAAQAYEQELRAEYEASVALAEDKESPEPEISGISASDDDAVETADSLPSVESMPMVSEGGVTARETGSAQNKVANEMEPECEPESQTQPKSKPANPLLALLCQLDAEIPGNSRTYKKKSRLRERREAQRRNLERFRQQGIDEDGSGEHALIEETAGTKSTDKESEVSPFEALLKGLAPPTPPRAADNIYYQDGEPEPEFSLLAEAKAAVQAKREADARRRGEMIGSSNKFDQLMDKFMIEEQVQALEQAVARAEKRRERQKKLGLLDVEAEKLSQEREVDAAEDEVALQERLHQGVHQAEQEARAVAIKTAMAATAAASLDTFRAAKGGLGVDGGVLAKKRTLGIKVEKLDNSLQRLLDSSLTDAVQRTLRGEPHTITDGEASSEGRQLSWSANQEVAGKVNLVDFVLAKKKRLQECQVAMGTASAVPIDPYETQVTTASSVGLRSLEEQVGATLISLRGDLSRSGIDRSTEDKIIKGAPGGLGQSSSASADTRLANAQADAPFEKPSAPKHNLTDRIIPENPLERTLADLETLRQRDKAVGRGFVVGAYNAEMESERARQELHQSLAVAPPPDAAIEHESAAAQAERELNNLLYNASATNGKQGRKSKVSALDAVLNKLNADINETDDGGNDGGSKTKRASMPATSAVPGSTLAATIQSVTAGIQADSASTAARSADAMFRHQPAGSRTITAMSRLTQHEQNLVLGTENVSRQIQLGLSAEQASAALLSGLDARQRLTPSLHTPIHEHSIDDTIQAAITLCIEDTEQDVEERRGLLRGWKESVRRNDARGVQNETDTETELSQQLESILTQAKYAAPAVTAALVARDNAEVEAAEMGCSSRSFSWNTLGPDATMSVVHENKGVASISLRAKRAASRRERAQRDESFKETLQRARRRGPTASEHMTRDEPDLSNDDNHTVSPRMLAGPVRDRETVDSNREGSVNRVQSTATGNKIAGAPSDTATDACEMVEASAKPVQE